MYIYAKKKCRDSTHTSTHNTICVLQYATISYSSPKHVCNKPIISENMKSLHSYKN